MGEACGTKGGEMYRECWQEKLKDEDVCCKSKPRFKDNIKMYFSGTFPSEKRRERGADHPSNIIPRLKKE